VTPPLDPSDHAMPDPHNEPRLEFDASIELLLARIVDGESSEADWSRFQREATGKPALWRELAEWQRQHAVMTATMGSAIEVADHVEAPAREGLSIRFSERLRLAASWGGWAVAATLALAAISGRIPMGPSAGMPGPIATSGMSGTAGQTTDFENQTASAFPIGTSALDPHMPAGELLRAYVAHGLEQGTVLGEMPRRIVSEPRLLPDGQIELLYARQILERQVVPRWYRVGSDELGRPLPIQPEIVRTSGRAY
jgi:hypothetical protein